MDTRNSYTNLRQFPMGEITAEHPSLVHYQTWITNCIEVMSLKSEMVVRDYDWIIYIEYL